MSYIKAENFSNPIPDTILAKKDFSFPSGGGSSTSSGTINNFSFQNGITFIQEIDEVISGNIGNSVVMQWTKTITIPDYLINTSRKIMAFVKILGTKPITNDLNTYISYSLYLNDKEFPNNYIGFSQEVSDFRIIVPVDIYPNPNNNLELIFSANGYSQTHSWNIHLWATICVI